jgi:hypothetical protein
MPPAYSPAAMPAPEIEVDSAIDELESLLKNPDVGAALAERGVNVSLALVIVDGLRAYAKGDKQKAIEELSLAAEEVAQRRELTERAASADKPS